MIIGAGSFSPEVEELASLIGYTDIAFLDDNPSTAYCSLVIGTTADIRAFRSKYDTAIVALGNNKIRMKYHEELKRCGYNIPILIHPTAYVSPTAVIAPGCIRYWCLSPLRNQLSKWRREQELQVPEDKGSRCCLSGY